jgi:cation diffusion facilitator CzcD-associated flavoprotein CzcO
MMKIIVFIIGGGLSGIILSFSLRMKSPKELVQGFVGGAIAGLVMAMMLPG